MAQLSIMSRNSGRFEDREEAGRLLGEALGKYRDSNAVILGIPRGGIIIAHEIAGILHASMDIVLSRKLGAPGNPELAIGALGEDGYVFLDDSTIRYLHISDSYIQKEKERQMGEIARRTGMYRKLRPRVSLTDRPVIVTDDGLATGATMKAALWVARQEKPAKLIAALPVGPEKSVMKLADTADEILCLRIPEYFMAVGQFYNIFDQISDSEVMNILAER